MTRSSQFELLKNDPEIEKTVLRALRKRLKEKKEKIEFEQKK